MKIDPLDVRKRMNENREEYKRKRKLYDSISDGSLDTFQNLFRDGDECNENVIDEMFTHDREDILEFLITKGFNHLRGMSRIIIARNSVRCFRILLKNDSWTDDESDIGLAISFQRPEMLMSLMNRNFSPGRSTKIMQQLIIINKRELFVAFIQSMNKKNVYQFINLHIFDRSIIEIFVFNGCWDLKLDPFDYIGLIDERHIKILSGRDCDNIVKILKSRSDHERMSKMYKYPSDISFVLE